MKTSQHKITPHNQDYQRDRSHMINIINAINNKLKFKQQTIYLVINYLDIIFNMGVSYEAEKELYAVCCLMIAAKFEENDPDIPNVNYFLGILLRYHSI
jgi:hypothetical protein